MVFNSQLIRSIGFAWRTVHGLPVLVSALLMMLSAGASAQTGEGERFSGAPLLILRNAKWNSEATWQYFETIAEDLDLERAKLSLAAQKASAEQFYGTNGVLLYLVPGVIPSVGTVTFKEVRDRSEFQALVLKAKGGNEQSTLTEEGDTLTLITKTTSTIEVVSADSDNDAANASPAVLEKSEPEPATTSSSESPATPLPEPDADDSSVTLSIGVDSGNEAPAGVVFSVTSTKTTEDGDAPETVVTEERRVFRYSDGFMFESTSDGLKTVELPSSDSLRQLDNAEVHSEVVFYPERVPEGIKQLGWGMISAGIGTDLQQRDEEADSDYELRRTTGDAQLIFLQSLFFDLQKAGGWVRMGKDVEPLEAQFLVEARNNSDLAKRLRELSGGGSYFAPILNDDAAATLHVCVRLPEHWQKVFLAYCQAYRKAFSDEESYSSTERDAFLDIVSAAEKTITEGQIEFFVKGGWTKESGPVLYYGVHIRSDASLMAQLFTTTGILEADCRAVDAELGVVAFSVDEDQESGAPSTAAFASADNAIWVAYGWDNCGQILAKSIRTCRESQQSQRAPLVTMSIDLDKLRSYEADDLHREFLTPQMMVDFLAVNIGLSPGEISEDATDSPGELFHRSSQLGGTQDLRVTVHSDESGLVVRGHAGAAFVRGIVAMFLNAE